MKIALFFHLVFLGAWLGCILTEGIYEHSIDHSPEQRALIASIHYATDKFIEVPAFLGVLITGLLLLPGPGLSPLFLTKIAFGSLAILLNAYCVWLVVKRKRIVDEKRFDEFDAIDRKQHVYGAFVLLTFFVALGIGCYYFVA